MKKMRLKKWVKIVISLFVLVCCLVVMNWQDTTARDNAMNECGSRMGHLIENYTREGDVYFTCKVNK